MSLAQHVTQAEGFDYQGFTSPNPYSTSSNIHESETSGHYHQFTINGDHERRFMYFTPTDLTSEEPHIAAYKVTFIKRFGMFCSNILFGIPALI
jgi:hypothetical protein